MSHHILLSRVDIRTVEDRKTGALTLRYTGRKLRFSDSLFGYPEGTFFAVVISEVELPEALTTLASAVSADLNTMPLVEELRRAVADTLIVDATMQAPEYLGMIAEPKTGWLLSDMRELEHRCLVAENRVRDLTRAIETQLRRRVTAPTSWPDIRSAPAVAPSGFLPFGQTLGTAPPRNLPAPDVEEEVDEEIEETTAVETSDAAGKRVMAAVKKAREEELPQRLPGGARRALSRLPAGIYVAHGAALDQKPDICSAMVAGAEGGKRGGEVAVIDWDGEWPVVARRYGSHGRIVYKVEDALRRNGMAGEAA